MPSRWTAVHSAVKILAQDRHHVWREDALPNADLEVDLHQLRGVLDAVTPRAAALLLTPTSTGCGRQLVCVPDRHPDPVDADDEVFE